MQNANIITHSKNKTKFQEFQRGGEVIILIPETKKCSKKKENLET